jgi:hypothetical protein
MFGIETNFANVSNYREAFSTWNNARPWKGKTGQHDERPLDKRTKKHMSVRMGNDEQIIFRLFRQDVVTYYKDGTIGLQKYSSQSTDRFANRLTPDGVTCWFNTKPYGLIVLWNKRWEEWHGGSNDEPTPKPTIYRLSDQHEIKLQKGEGRPWDLVDVAASTVPFEKCLLDKTKANAALKKYGYNDFRSWAKAIFALKPNHRRTHWYHNKQEELALFLEGPEAWSKLIERADNADHMTRKVRDIIYALEKCHKIEQVPFATSYAQVKNIVASRPL